MPPPAAADVSRGIVGGLVASILTLTTSLSFAALVFSGPLAAGLHYGVSATMLTAGIMSLVLRFLSSTHFTIGGTNGNSSAIYALSAAVIAHSVGDKLPLESLIETVLVGIAISTAVTAAVQYTIGALRWGRWMRFIPYPVIGGVLAAAGWLLSLGAIRVIGATPQQIAAGVACALAVMIVVQRIKHPLALPGTLVVAMVAFYATAAVLRLPIEGLRAAGWLFSIPSGPALANPWMPSALAHVSWHALLPHIGDLLTVAVVSTLAVLLSTSGLELSTHVEADLDNDLRAQGVGNLLVALAGGFTACQQFTVTLMSYKVSGKNRIPPIVVALVCFATIFAGSALVNAIPRFIFGALILATGLGLVLEWLIRTARRLPIYDYLSILAIVVVVARFGFVAGVVAGILIGCIIFVVTYSRVPVIKHSVTGMEFRSGVVRSNEETEALNEHGAAIRILLLQGFVFFGMADAMYRAVKTIVESADRSVEFIILEFKSVHGVDSSAVSSFAKMHRLADAHGIVLLFSGMSEGMEHKLQGGETEARTILHYESMDNALEFCEGGLLAKYAPSSMHAISLLDWLTDELGDREHAERLPAYLQERTLAQGEQLCREGERADEMFLISQGRVSLEAADTNGAGHHHHHRHHHSHHNHHHHRLRSLGDRTIFGEMGLYRDLLRSATVNAEVPSVVYVLTRKEFERMSREDPALAATFHTAIVRVLADRVASGNSMINALRR